MYENEHLYSARDSFDAFRLSLPQDYLIRMISLCEDVEAGIRWHGGLRVQVPTPRQVESRRRPWPPLERRQDGSRDPQHGRAAPSPVQGPRNDNEKQAKRRQDLIPFPNLTSASRPRFPTRGKTRRKRGLWPSTTSRPRFSWWAAYAWGRPSAFPSRRLPVLAGSLGVYIPGDSKLKSVLASSSASPSQTPQGECG